jgi:hypothetical protein
MTDRDLLSTPIDGFLALVRHRKRLSFTEAAEEMKEAEETIERWSLVLDKKGLIKLVYPENPFDKPFVRAVEARK